MPMMNMNPFGSGKKTVDDDDMDDTKGEGQHINE